jgi:thiamine-phosphate pyrophosphorylase
MSSMTSALRDERRAQLSRARLMLLFTPELCPPGRDPFEVLERALPHLDVIQVRIKDPELGTSAARAVHDCALRVLELVERCASRAQVLVNDRVDVAAVLAQRGLVGVHVGADDVPPALARELLGEDALIGLSTHTGTDVALAAALPVDYLGFGPVHATTTRGYARGLGAEAAWVASCASVVPVFPIGGIDASNAGELAAVGRAAVSSAILGAEDPAATAAAIRAALEADD